MTRLYGHAAHGKRVPESAPAGHWRTLTLLGALTLKGVKAFMTIESPTDGDVFLTYLEQVLGPQLQPGEIVILDNLSAHKVAGGRQIIEAHGAQLLYLPPYSPDFNPIETSLVENQATLAHGQITIPRIAGSSHHRCPRCYFFGECHLLVPPLRLRGTPTVKPL